MFQSQSRRRADAVETVRSLTLIEALEPRRFLSGAPWGAPGRRA